MTSSLVFRRLSSLTSVMATAIALLFASGGCSTGRAPDGSGGSGSGGTTSNGGTTVNGGATTSGGAPGSGGASTRGGAPGTGGVPAAGGSAGGTAAASSGTGGVPGTGGVASTGGAAGIGGTRGSGGATGTLGSGGILGSGGVPGTGGTSTVTTTPSTCDPTLPSTGTYYVASSSGSGSTCSASSPCSASTAIGKLSAGQTAYLRGGTYSANIMVTKSGSAGSSITIAAYPCELPILDPGSFNISSTYVSVQGIVTRNSAAGFGNGWTGGGTTNSNGHLEYINCIADMHSRNGIAFYSATGVHIKQCIVAHTGFSTTSSWSSAVNIFGAQGTYQDNIVEQTIAFENMDNQKHTDGSGFIVDDIGTGTTFINNIGFRNGGSCIRLTTTTGTHILNNSCYNNGLDPAATGPSTPDEIFFSSSATTSGAVLANNIAVATGKGGDTQAFFGAPSGASNNVTNNAGAIDFWVDAAGISPDFHLKSTASTIIGKGTTTEAPAEDIGFDPKCITKTAPTGTGVQSWWLYSIDYDYIKSIGGVAQCFHPKARTGAPDIGAYAL